MSRKYVYKDELLPFKATMIREVHYRHLERQRNQYVSRDFRELRKLLNMSQKQVADHMGCSVHTIKRMELGCKIIPDAYLLAMARLAN